jgi:hypothetical protein
MAWDTTKSDFETRDVVPDDEKLTASEWNTHVTDQKSHSGRHESGGADEVDHDSLAGFVSNEHVDHATVDITAGDGLKGGGDITTSRTLNIEPADFAGTLLSDDGSDNLQVDESDISHDGIDQSTVSEEDHHPRGGYTRTDVTSTSVTASAWDSAWVDTSAAGAAVTVTLPADADVADGDRVEVGIEDATNDTDVAANTGQSILGANPTLSQVADTLTFEYKSSTSTWMVR